MKYTNCPNLEYIKNMPKIYYMLILDCILFKKYHNFPKIEQLKFINCLSLGYIDSLFILLYLTIIKCENINGIRDLPLIDQFVFKNNNDTVDFDSDDLKNKITTEE
jgi:hypothetical protein